MMIHNITPSVHFYQWLKRLDTQFNEPTNQNSIKVPKFDKPTTLFKNFGDQCNKFPNVPSLPDIFKPQLLLKMKQNRENNNMMFQGKLYVENSSFETDLMLHRNSFTNALIKNHNKVKNMPLLHTNVCQNFILFGGIK